MYILCKHMKLKILVSSIALQQIKDVSAVTRQEDIMPNIEYTCKDTVVHYFDAKVINFRLSSFCHSTIIEIKTLSKTVVLQAVKIMLFTSDAQYYVAIKLCRITGSIHLFKITSTLVPENVI